MSVHEELLALGLGMPCPLVLTAWFSPDELAQQPVIVQQLVRHAWDRDGIVDARATWNSDIGRWEGT